MPIDCPAAQQSVSVTVNSGGQGTICVQGTVITSSQGQVNILVQVVAGTQNDFPTTAPTSGTVSATFNGQHWCASGVPVPALGPSGSSLPGTPFTVVAWQVASGTVERMMIQPFFGVSAGLGGTDCCSGCSGSGSSFFLVSELAATPPLEVTIPDGPHAGLHRATAAGPLTWTMKVRRSTYTISVEATGKLFVQRSSSKGLSVSMAGHPFSATFHGKVFQATGDVVVTIA